MQKKNSEKKKKRKKLHYRNAKLLDLTIKRIGNSLPEMKEQKRTK